MVVERRAGEREVMVKTAAIFLLLLFFIFKKINFYFFFKKYMPIVLKNQLAFKNLAIKTDPLPSLSPPSVFFLRA